ncbi:Sjoegren syndrome/scleroderma autoantigen 1 [Carpediemonas membranifera]|uniref:Sjoegren syndrome/scleroderma autoantigen 1 n=1 Tax=Carpediemonas membranifera TaxID=201153 RepID=A0A8J6E3R1_9EUKA|nr:Sjoegren syndrome/scleroderma autoantigen 1 [Carpediemonas membranifera]|eukprot:KAG9396263.1 Sjoegren syndrome/scleroderma autoantigen 1 [Carpediemonas membranifera]
MEMSRYLLNGWSMTSAQCKECDTVLLKKKNQPSVLFCVSCNKKYDFTGSSTHSIPPRSIREQEAAEDSIDPDKDSDAFLQAVEIRKQPLKDLSPSASEEEASPVIKPTEPEPAQQPEKEAEQEQVEEQPAKPVENEESSSSDSSESGSERSEIDEETLAAQRADLKARMEAAEARYESESAAQARFSRWLLGGWTMTAKNCPSGCSMPLMRNKDGHLFCPVCEARVLTEAEAKAAGLEQQADEQEKRVVAELQARQDAEAKDTAALAEVTKAQQQHPKLHGSPIRSHREPFVRQELKRSPTHISTEAPEPGSRNTMLEEALDHFAVHIRDRAADGQVSAVVDIASAMNAIYDVLDRSGR